MTAEQNVVFRKGDKVQVMGYGNGLDGEYGVVTGFGSEYDTFRVQIGDESLLIHRRFLWWIGSKDAAPIVFERPSEKTTSRQVGGDHYNMPIQPVEFIERNNLGFCVGNCIKYLCRYKRKNGREDLEKARHYIDLLIQMEYPDFENVE